MNRKTLLLFIFSCFFISNSFAQSIENQTAETKNVPRWKSSTPPVASRLVYGRSAEVIHKGQLHVAVSGRFGRIKEGFDDWFGLDTAFVRIGADYGITDKLTVGFGRTKLDKEFDLNAKYKILQQSSSGDKNMPLTLSVYGAVTATSKKLSGADFGDRLGTVLQMLVTREFYDKFTLQMAPIWVYNARKFTSDDSRHIFSVGLGAHVKIKERMSVNLEYYPLFDNMKFAGTSSPLSLGFNLQTHGHIFQVFIGNSMAPNEHLLFLHTKDKWKDGNIHIGFNLIRSFNIGKAL